jgi:hypothetical protein
MALATVSKIAKQSLRQQPRGGITGRQGNFLNFPSVYLCSQDFLSKIHHRLIASNITKLYIAVNFMIYFKFRTKYYQTFVMGWTENKYLA